MFNSSWYQNLIKPQYSPPDWIFAPMWSILYIFIFTSLALYINAISEDKKIGYIFFAIQMFLNIIWTPVFFAMQNIKGGLIIIVWLNIFVILTILEFFKVSKIAALLLIPYLIWILFAAYLNLQYLILN